MYILFGENVMSYIIKSNYNLMQINEDFIIHL